MRPRPGKPPTKQARLRRAWAWPALPLALALVVLRQLPPTARRWLPACPFHQFTGLLCPGCGGTRALFALLHGDFHAAWAANPLVVLALPCLGSYALVAFSRRRLPALPPGVAALLLLGTLVFGVARNVLFPR